MKGKENQRQSLCRISHVHFGFRLEFSRPAECTCYSCSYLDGNKATTSAGLVLSEEGQIIFSLKRKVPTAHSIAPDCCNKPR